MLSILLGLVTVGFSLWGIFFWREAFLFVMKGFLPLCFLLGGIVAVIAGVSAMGGKPPLEKGEKK